MSRVACDCEIWRSMERMSEIAHALVAAGIVDTRDIDAAHHEIARVAEGWGMLPRWSTAGARSSVPESEQRRLLALYVEFCRTTNWPPARRRYLDELGVPPSTITHWARKHLGPGRLHAAGPTSYLRATLAELEIRPWQTRAELQYRGVLPRVAASGVLSGYGKRFLERRRRDDGRWEYRCAG